MKPLFSISLVLGLCTLLGCAVLTGPSGKSPCHVDHLQCEYLTDPLGLDVTQPRLSWQLIPARSSGRGLGQTAYQILVANGRERLDAGVGDLWDTGKVASDMSNHIVYAGQLEDLHQVECQKKTVRFFNLLV